MTDVRQQESTMDSAGRDRPTDPEFRQPTEVDEPATISHDSTSADSTSADSTSVDSTSVGDEPRSFEDEPRDIAETSGMREVPGAREAIGVVDNPTTEPVSEDADLSNPPNFDEPVPGPRAGDEATPGPRADDLSEGELSQREIGDREANEPAPAHLPGSDVDSNYSVDERPTGAAEAPYADATTADHDLDERTTAESLDPVPVAADAPSMDTEADVDSDTEPSTGPAPGDVELAPVAALWPGDSADGFRERWREIQLQFVDEPKAAAEQADDLVEEAVAALTTSLQRTRAELGQWRSSGAEDSGETEHLRLAVQRYRDFLDTVVGL